MAIVVPDEGLFRQWVRDHGFVKESELPFSELCSEDRIRKAYLEEMRNFGTVHDLGNLQQVINVAEKFDYIKIVVAVTFAALLFLFVILPT